jgi:hypothetical protein
MSMSVARPLWRLPSKSSIIIAACRHKVIEARG